MTEPFMLFHHEISVNFEARFGALTCTFMGETTQHPQWFNVGGTRISTYSSSSSYAIITSGRETQLARTTIPTPADDQHDGLWSCQSADSGIIYGLIGLYGGNYFHACKIENT